MERKRIPSSTWVAWKRVRVCVGSCALVCVPAVFFFSRKVRGEALVFSPLRSVHRTTHFDLYAALRPPAHSSKRRPTPRLPPWRTDFAQLERLTGLRRLGTHDLHLLPPIASGVMTSTPSSAPPAPRRFGRARSTTGHAGPLLRSAPPLRLRQSTRDRLRAPRCAPRCDSIAPAVSSPPHPTAGTRGHRRRPRHRSCADARDGPRSLTPDHHPDYRARD